MQGGFQLLGLDRSKRGVESVHPGKDLKENSSLSECRFLSLKYGETFGILSLQRQQEALNDLWGAFEH